jgi:hypothetical protein
MTKMQGSAPSREPPEVFSMLSIDETVGCTAAWVQVLLSGGAGHSDADAW